MNQEDRGPQGFDEIMWSGDLPLANPNPAGWLVEIPRPKWWPRWLVNLVWILGLCFGVAGWIAGYALAWWWTR